MSVCDVENGLPEKQMNIDEPSEESRLKRMPVPEEDLGKLLEPKPSSQPEQMPPVNGQTSAPSPQEFESSEPVIKKEEEEETEVKEEEAPETHVEKPPTPPIEETPQPRPPTPKDDLETTPAPPPVVPPAPLEELSRKRSIEKEHEGEGSSGSDSDSSRKKNRTEQETETQPTNIPNGNSLPPAEDERERMISDFVAEVSVSSDSVTAAADRLAKEVENLAELAAAKELEWNAILRVKKLKEEMLERVLRRKRMNHFDEQFNSDLSVPDLSSTNKGIPGGMQFPLRHPRLAEMNKLPQRPILPKPVGSPYSPMSIGREGRNGPIVDVKSIIDDYSGGYRSRHPESPARRGRRVRGVASSEQRFPSVNPSLISMANMALGTGASVRTVSDHVSYMGMGGMEQARGENKEPSRGAKPYPEVTLHPVSPPSLLHQVLTKSAPPRSANFSPTLARLLTAPERPAPPPHFRPPSRVSIADILTSTKLKDLQASKETCMKYPSIVLALLNEKDDEKEDDENTACELNVASNGHEEQLDDDIENSESPVEIPSKKAARKTKPEKKRSSQCNDLPQPKESTKTSKSVSTSQEEVDSSTSLSTASEPNSSQSISLPKPLRFTLVPSLKLTKTSTTSSPKKVLVLKNPSLIKACSQKISLVTGKLSQKEDSKSSQKEASSSSQKEDSKPSQKENDKPSQNEGTLRGTQLPTKAVIRAINQRLLKPGHPPLKRRPPTPIPQPPSPSDSSSEPDQDTAPKPKKSRNEITITPVSGNPGTKSKEDIVCLDEDDGDSGALVIDEGADDIPTCQGCRSKSAQFVCAGCGNQWYCSRECQVSAWEEHSDMCSG